MFRNWHFKPFFLGILVIWGLQATGQKYCKWGERGTDHLLKTNLINFAFKSFNLEYERSFKTNISLGVNVSFTPSRDLPFKSSLTKNITDENSKKSVEEARLNQFSIVPQMRFYFGDRDVFTRFYASPYIKYTRYQTNTTLYYKQEALVGGTLASESISIPISGNLNTLSAGLAVGLQFQLLKSIYLDWKIMGNHYGIVFGKGTGKSNYPLTEDIQQDIKKSLEKLDDIPIYSFAHTVDQTGVTVRPKGLNIGITSALSVGYRF